MNLGVWIIKHNFLFSFKIYFGLRFLRYSIFSLALVAGIIHLNNDFLKIFVFSKLVGKHAVIVHFDVYPLVGVEWTFCGGRVVPIGI